MAHYVQNLGDEPLRYLEMFRSPRFMDVSLNQWMALTPPELVQAHFAPVVADRLRIGVGKRFNRCCHGRPSIDCLCRVVVWRAVAYSRLDRCIFWRHYCRIRLRYESLSLSRLWTSMGGDTPSV
jgi:hypothetical protein